MNKWMKKLTAALCAAVLMCGMAVTAYAGGGEEWSGLDPVEPLPTETVDPGEGFTEDGNLVTRDLLYDKATNKQFITVQTRKGETYYLVIDYDKPIDEEADIYETYFLNLVDDRDLLALLSEDEKPTPTPTAAPTPTPTKEPVQTDETEPKQNGTVVAGTLMLAILGGGAFWYLNQRKKKESKPQPSYDEYEDDEDDETRDDDLNE